MLLGTAACCGRIVNVKTNKHRKSERRKIKIRREHYGATCMQFVRSGCGGNSQPYAWFILTHTQLERWRLHVHTHSHTHYLPMTHRIEPFLLLCLTTFTFLTLSRSRVYVIIIVALMHAFSMSFSRSLSLSLVSAVRLLARSQSFSFFSARAIQRPLVVYFSNGEH